jgi:hypothetical protein
LRRHTREQWVPPPSIAAQLLGDELPVQPGVFAPEEVIPWAPFCRELERRGMIVSPPQRERG